MQFTSDNLKSTSTDLLLLSMHTTVAEKLSNLYDSKWSFSATVNIKRKMIIKFSMDYNNPDTEENFKINGVSTFKDTFQINKLTINCAIKIRGIDNLVSFSFSTDENKGLAFTDVADNINNILNNSKEYMYFVDDYHRYINKDIFEYVSELSKTQVLNWDEDVSFDLEGIYHHYTSEFGEESFEIVKVESSSQKNSKHDKLTINISNRLCFTYKKINSKRIAKLLDSLTPSIIDVQSFLITTTKLSCIYKNHPLQQINALVCIDTGSGFIDATANAYFCPECEEYYISEAEYNRLCLKGRLCCQVISYDEYKSINTDSKLAERSLLKNYGYSVNATENLSSYERKRILSFIIENDIASIDRVINYLEWFIRTHSNKNQYKARKKWNDDIAFLRQYKKVNRSVRIGEMYKKNIHYLK